MKHNNGHVIVNTGSTAEAYPFTGKLTTLDLDRNFALVVNSEPFSDRSPSHYIFMRGASEKPVMVGRARYHTIKKGDNAGKNMFSLQLTSPELPDLEFAAWPDDDDPERWYVLFDRSKDSVTVDDSGERARADANGTGTADEIPY